MCWFGCLLCSAGACVRGGFGTSGQDPASRDSRPLPSDSTNDDTGNGTDAPTSDSRVGAVFEAAEVLLTESFDDADLVGRGWYDNPSATISTAERAPGSAASWECTIDAGQSACRGGSPRRHLFAATDAVYIRYQVKFSTNYQRGGTLFLLTDADRTLIGPASSQLAVLFSQVDGRIEVRLEDNARVDSNCVRLTDDTIVGCGSGGFEDYTFSEARSVASCNGLVGIVDRWECFSAGSTSGYFSYRIWSSPEIVFSETPGPDYKNSWHLVEIYVRMNSIVGGIGVPDGVIALRRDGQVVLALERVLLRTGTQPDLRFNQLLTAADFQAVSDQSVWFDELSVARASP